MCLVKIHAMKLSVRAGTKYFIARHEVQTIVLLHASTVLCFVSSCEIVGRLAVKHSVTVFSL
jgi:hypothetical protein